MTIGIDILPFDGTTFDPEIDGKRLTALSFKVFALMADGHWRTLEEIRTITGGSEASISARLRDYRKAAWGHRTVDRRRRAGGGLYEYRLVGGTR
jgi:hypothetical protein